MDAQNEAFEDWFNGSWTDYSLRSEWFHADCDIEDKTARKKRLYTWLHAAFVVGHEAGKGLDATS